MTTPIHKNQDDLQNFIEGHDDLSRQLNAYKNMPEKTSPSELDVAILLRIETALLHEKSQEKTKNNSTHKPTQRWKQLCNIDFLLNLTKHWQIPAGITALLVMSMSWQLIQQNTERQRMEALQAKSTLPLPLTLAKKMATPREESVSIPDAIEPMKEERKVAAIMSSKSTELTRLATPKIAQDHAIQLEKAPLLVSVPSVPSVAALPSPSAPPPVAVAIAPILALEPSIESIVKVDIPVKQLSATGMSATLASASSNTLNESIADTTYDAKQVLAKVSRQNDAFQATKKMPLATQAAKPSASLPSIESANSWLARIQEELQQQRTQSALREWEAFRKAYPNEIIPEAMLKKLQYLDTLQQKSPLLEKKK